MKRFSSGLLIGLLTGLILATATFVFAGSPIKLFVNGTEIHSDVPAQIINGRTLVPARPLAEALGAKVEWDAASNSVVVTSANGQQQTASNQASNQDRVTETTFNGLNAIVINGETYFKGRDYYAKYRKIGDIYSPSYIYDKSSNSLKYQDYTGKTTIITNDINAVNLYMETVWINSKYYK